MKKSLIFGTMCLATLAACQKENISAPQAEQITRTISVVEPETKSKYTFGEGIALEYTEFMNVNYWTGTEDPTTENGLTPVTNGYATPDSGTKTWSFTHPDAGEGTVYNYQFIMPYDPNMSFNSKKSGAQVRLSPVQVARSNSFDPSQDYLVGQAQLGRPAVGDIEPIQFKRLFVPFQLGLKGNDIKNKTYTAVTFEVHQPASKENCLSTLGYVNTNTSYNSKIFSSGEDYNSNSLTALFSGLGQNKLNPKGGIYNCWFMVNPSTFPAGTEITVSLFTTEGKYSKTFAVEKELVFKSDLMNKMTVSLSNDNFTAGELFTVTSSGKKTDHASQDRIDISQADFAGAPTNSVFSSSVRISTAANKDRIIYTNKEGDAPVRKIRIYTSQLSAANNKKAEYLTVYESDGTTVLGTENNNFGYKTISKTGGYVEVDFGKDVDSFIIKNTSPTSVWLYISAIHVIPAE